LDVYFCFDSRWKIFDQWFENDVVLIRVSDFLLIYFFLFFNLRKPLDVLQYYEIFFSFICNQPTSCRLFSYVMNANNVFYAVAYETVRKNVVVFIVLTNGERLEESNSKCIEYFSSINIMTGIYTKLNSNVKCIAAWV